MKQIILFFSFLFLICEIHSQTIPEIDSIILDELNSIKTPAIVVSVIKNGEIIHLSASGLIDLENNKPAKLSTPFHIASVSKSVLNMAIFKLIELKKLSLSSDINEYLPFKVLNPYFPDEKITIKELLNHRSGIIDNFDIYDPFWDNPNGDPKIELSSFLFDYLHVDGKLYSSKHFRSGKNHKSFEYSNTGFALLGLIIESVSGVSLEEFCQSNIFEPLNMANTSWFLKNFDSTLVAKTYSYSDSTGYTFKGHNGYPDYPAGQLRTSIQDFSNLIQEYLNAKNNSVLLKRSSINLITPNPWYAHHGFYTWFLTAKGSTIYYFNEGGDVGTHAKIIMDVKKRNAVIVFVNSKANIEDTINRIEKNVFNE